MKRTVLTLIFCAALAVALPGLARGADSVEAVLFYGRGCPHCAKMETLLVELQREHPELQVRTYEVYFDRANIELLEQYADAYGVEITGVPTLFLGGQVISGYYPDLVRQNVQSCLKTGCISPVDKVNGIEEPAPPAPPPEPEPAPPTTAPVAGPEQPEAAPTEPTDRPTEDEAPAPPPPPAFPESLTVWAVISGAAVDAINPCAFAVLIILMTTILGTGSRRRSLWAGCAFSLSVFVSYLLMGLGLYSAIQAAGISRLFYFIIGILAILIGLFNLKDWLWYGKWFIMEVPLSWRPRLKSVIRGVTSVPGAFLIGFVVSLFLLPCTSGPYIVVLGLLAHATTRAAAVPLLILYNLIFVLPMVLITLAVSCGLTTADRAEAWRQKKLRVLHLIAGLILIGLGIAMLAGGGVPAL